MSSLPFMRVRHFLTSCLPVAKVALSKLEVLGVSEYLSSFNIVPNTSSLVIRFTGVLMNNEGRDTSNDLVNGALEARRVHSYGVILAWISLIVFFLLSFLNLSVSTLGFSLVSFLVLIRMAEFAGDCFRSCALARLCSKWLEKVESSQEKEEVSNNLETCFKITSATFRCARIQTIILLAVQISLFILTFFSFFFAHTQMQLAFTLIGFVIWSFESLITSCFDYFCASYKRVQTFFAVLNRDVETFLPTDEIFNHFCNKISLETAETCLIWEKTKVLYLTLSLRFEELEVNFRKLLDSTLSELKAFESNKHKCEDSAERMIDKKMEIRRFTAGLSFLQNEISKLSSYLKSFEKSSEEELDVTGEICSKLTIVLSHWNHMTEIRSRLDDIEAETRVNFRILERLFADANQEWEDSDEVRRLFPETGQ